MTNDQKTIKELRKKYPYIFAWGKVLKSKDYYIADQLIRAQLNNAPKTAIYVKEEGWSTTGSLSSASMTQLNTYVNN